MESTGTTPFRPTRAGFLALTQAGLAGYFLALAGWRLVSAGGSPAVGGFIAAGAIAAVLAVFFRYRPGTVDRGTDPAPRRRFEFAGLLGGGLVLALVVGFVLTDVV